MNVQAALQGLASEAVAEATGQLTLRGRVAWLLSKSIAELGRLPEVVYLHPADWCLFTAEFLPGTTEFIVCGVRVECEK